MATPVTTLLVEVGQPGRTLQLIPRDGEPVSALPYSNPVLGGEIPERPNEYPKSPTHITPEANRIHRCGDQRIPRGSTCQFLHEGSGDERIHVPGPRDGVRCPREYPLSPKRQLRKQNRDLHGDDRDSVQFLG